MAHMNELEEIRPKQMWEGVVVRAVEGERMTLSVVELDPDTLVPEHRHHNEQIGMLLSGRLTFTIDGERQELGPGGTWRILANVPHEALTGPEGAVAVEAFSPIRDDWHDIADQETRPPRWPA